MMPHAGPETARLRLQLWAVRGCACVRGGSMTNLSSVQDGEGSWPSNGNRGPKRSRLLCELVRTSHAMGSLPYVGRRPKKRPSPNLRDPRKQRMHSFLRNGTPVDCHFSKNASNAVQSTECKASAVVVRSAS